MPKSGVIKNQWMRQGFGLDAKPNPTFPRQGLQLYADFWHPDQQPSGYLNNGTGIATEAGTAFVVGNNTINVTTQGNFQVYVSGSGTATTGTATVSGSPQSLTTGWNTVTVTGTGTITIALNNVIISKDINAHLMTVTGATWGSQGRTFDGISSVIITSSSPTNLAKGVSFGGWASTDNVTQSRQVIVYNGTGASDGYGILVNSNATTDGSISVLYGAVAFKTSTQLFGSGKHFAFATIGSGTPPTLTIYYDGSSVYTDSASTPNAPTTNARIGSDAIGFFKGTIGETFIYNKILSSTEIQQIYNATKWRYV